MSAQVSDPRNRPSPLRLAVLVLLVVALVVACGVLWALLTVPAVAIVPVAAAGGVAGLVVSVAVATATYHATTARRSRDRLAWAETRADHLEREAHRLSAEVLPTLGTRLREGQSADLALAEVVQPTDEALRRLTHETARELGESERRSGAATAHRAAMENEVAYLADEALPTLVGRLRASRTTSVESVLDEVAQPTDEALRRLTHETARELGESERRGGAAMAACASSAARVQAQVTTLLARLRELQDQYGEQEGVFADLLDLDHHVSQIGRLADSFALLSGGRSGRRWTRPIVMESILRGAMGRISAYRRVRTYSTSTVGIAGYAAEGVMHTLAELMDNAATFSAHDTEVHVYVEEEDTGVMVTIEDSGLGMRTRERHRAETLVSEPRNLTTLSGTRLGLAVVGRLAAKYGLTVNFRPSSRGGTGVVVMIPHHLVTQPSQEFDVTSAATTPAVEPPSPGQPPATSGATPNLAGSEETDELPKRRRGATLAAASRSMSAPAKEPTRHRADPAARLAAFRNASGHGRGDSPDGDEGFR